MKKLSMIIVSYNTKDLLHDCIKNLLESTNPDTSELIVVDNASKDGSAAMVKEIFPTVKLIETENKGLAVASNKGFQVSSGEYILYVGTDAYPKRHDIDGLINYMDVNQIVGIATAKLVTRDGKLDRDAHRGFPTPWASFTHFSGLEKIYPYSPKFNQYFLGNRLRCECAHEIDLCISHFMMVRRKVFEDIKGWDEEFFVFGEDVDFCYRTKQAGWKIMYVPEFSVVHFKGSGIGIRKESKDIKTVGSTSKETQNRMQFERTRAMKLFYKKHLEKLYPAPVNWLVLSGINILAFLRTKKL